MQELKIDLVYLWVDGNDKEWLLERNYWARQLNLKEEIALNACRYIDNQELKYSLRSAQMYAPWINKIFIITNGQIPKWLDPNHPKIKIINHAEIMPKYSLPSFNSEAIETCIANIPDLSEYFLCANDDKFFASPLTSDYFFDRNNNPIVNMRNQNWTHDEINKSLYKQSYIYTVNVFSEKISCRHHYKNLEPFHCIEAYRKSYYLECKTIFASEFNSTVNKKFRSPQSIQHPIVDIFMVEQKQCTLKMNPKVTEQIFEEQVENLYLPIKSYKEMKKMIASKKPKLLCLNDGDYILENDRKNLKFLLEELYPEKQAWEKEDVEETIPLLSMNTNTIVFAFNNEYAKNFTVTLNSLVQNTDADTFYDIVILNMDITDKYKEILSQNLPQNISLRFFDISDVLFKYFKDFNFITGTYWTKEIYYRILIPMIFTNYQKVLYLDSDIIVNQDIKKIFDISFDNNEIIAVKDSISSVLHIDKNKDRLNHITNILKISEPERYFNSGLILFNLAKIDKQDYIDRLNKAKQISKLLFPDQDILNKIFEKRTKLIHESWNYCCGTLIWHPSYLNEIKSSTKEEFLEARQNPKIIHYTSPKKPWNSVDEEYFETFWKYARTSDIYEELIYQMCKVTTQNTLIEEMKYINLLMKTETSKKIMLWGASLFLEDFFRKYSICNDNILGIIDKNPARKGEFIGQYEVFTPDILEKFKPNEIIITIVNSTEQRAKEVKNFLEINNYRNIEVKTI